jgi:hypothetical protein
MRWIKMMTIVSLWLFFFGVLIVVHLCISVLRFPNALEDRESLGGRFYLVNEGDSHAVTID